MASDRLITLPSLPQISLRTMGSLRREATNRVEAVVFQQHKIFGAAAVKLKSADTIDGEDGLKARTISVLVYTESIEGDTYIADVGVEGGIVSTLIISIEVGDVLAIESAGKDSRRCRCNVGAKKDEGLNDLHFA